MLFPEWCRRKTLAFHTSVLFAGPSKEDIGMPYQRAFCRTFPCPFTINVDLTTDEYMTPGCLVH